MPKIMIGTFQNDRYQDLLDVVQAGVESGFTGFDTAPSYGTELQLGNAIQECMAHYQLTRKDFFISDKVDAWQMQRTNGDVRCYVEEAIRKMNIEYLDLLLVHWPVPEYIEQTWRHMQQLKESGLVKRIGICNVRVRHLQEWHSRDIIPEYIQIERHPLRTCALEMQYCIDNGIKVVSYSPLCRMHKHIKESDVLNTLMLKYNKNIGQIILRWHIETGSIPVFMSKRSSRIKENMDIFDFTLTQEEVNDINTLNENYKLFPESWGCPGF